MTDSPTAGGGSDEYQHFLKWQTRPMAGGGTPRCRPAAAGPMPVVLARAGLETYALTLNVIKRRYSFESARKQAYVALTLKAIKR